VVERGFLGYLAKTLNLYIRDRLEYSMEELRDIKTGKIVEVLEDLVWKATGGSYRLKDVGEISLKDRASAIDSIESAFARGHGFGKENISKYVDMFVGQISDCGRPEVYSGGLDSDTHGAVESSKGFRFLDSLPSFAGFSTIALGIAAYALNVAYGVKRGLGHVWSQGWLSRELLGGSNGEAGQMVSDLNADTAFGFVKAYGVPLAIVALGGAYCLTRTFYKGKGWAEKKIEEHRREVTPEMIISYAEAISSKKAVKI